MASSGCHGTKIQNKQTKYKTKQNQAYLRTPKTGDLASEAILDAFSEEPLISLIRMKKGPFLNHRFFTHDVRKLAVEHLPVPRLTDFLCSLMLNVKNQLLKNQQAFPFSSNL